MPWLRQYVSSKTLTDIHNTTLRGPVQAPRKTAQPDHQLEITDAVDAQRIKRKGVGSGKKFAEYVPYWA